MAEALLSTWRKSPVLVRVLPFAIFVGLTAGQGAFGETSRYWFYLAKTVVGLGLIWLMIPCVPEMRWRISWEAVAVGIVVFALWVGLDSFYPKLGKPASVWNPSVQFESAAPLAVGFVLVRIIGSTLVVPPLEEVFYRSFLYRYIKNPNFQTVSLNEFSWGPFLVTALVFGFVHHEWLAGTICGMLYQALVLRNNRLGDAMTAHAITNFLLGVWVVWKGAWHFW